MAKVLQYLAPDKLSDYVLHQLHVAHNSHTGFLPRFANTPAWLLPKKGCCTGCFL